MRRFAVACLVCLAAAGALAAAATNGLSLFGDLKYGADFTHFDYADPSAPKGGTMRFDAIGTFDTLNPFVVNGVAASGIGMTFDTLAAASEDEPASVYGLVAKSIEVAPDKRSVLYVLHRRARFHDGTRITPEDVIWTLDMLRKKGLPAYRTYYAGVAKAEKEGEDGVRFSFKTAKNRELAQIIGEMPVLSKAYWKGRDFAKTTLKAPLGSGPYEVAGVQPGQSITYKRVRNYWGRDLPVNKGRYNVDQIRYDYYRDNTVALEAFKAGQYDVRVENAAKDWATGYNSPALRAGLIKKVEIPNRLPSGMQGFGYNLRRPIFQDRRVREALAYAYDFNWENKYLFYGEYTRTRSYFDNSELAATGVPKGDELKILEPFRAQLPKRLFTEEYDPPEYKQPSDIRTGLEKALKLLQAAGWGFKGEALVNDETGQPFSFEILLDNPQFERVVLPFVANLKRIGIAARVRTVDTPQYQQRMQNFDFDVAIVAFGQSLSPGNEQREYWGSASADEKGSPNLLGVKSKAIDELIAQLVHAPDRKSLVAHTRALDRALQWGFYVIPQFHIGAFRVAYWDKFGRPAVTPKYGIGFNTWWVKPGAEQSLEAKKAAVPKK
ncbi:MAG TPA: extracellular solute-binding protein [Stellaceae bacterium]|nr:extracellular solute-binding protein [Stellaceae bacterium]